jgi:hypothetical protein
MEYYNSNIQLDKKVIDDIFENFKPETKMLVFGLGYDSKMWFQGNPKTYFIENKDEYIELNKVIPVENIIKYDYQNINVLKSFFLNINQISNYKIPEKIMKHAPYDIILIDGPMGDNSHKPGRLIPCFWATKLSKKGTLIYIDDSLRKLESYCIRSLFKNNEKTIFPNRNQSTKIIF